VESVSGPSPAQRKGTARTRVFSEDRGEASNLYPRPPARRILIEGSARKVYPGLAVYRRDLIGSRVGNEPICGGGRWNSRPVAPARYCTKPNRPRSLPFATEVPQGPPATHDEQIPRESALLLAAGAGDPVRQIWLPYGHLDSTEREVIREVADSTFRWFGFEK